jgi:hypothetical protein
MYRRQARGPGRSGSNALSMPLGHGFVVIQPPGGLLQRCTITVYTGGMASAKQVRRSVTLPTSLAEQVERIARKRRLSDNRVLVELVEQGLEAQRQKEKAFFALAERFRAAADPEEVKQLGDEMGRLIFGR